MRVYNRRMDTEKRSRGRPAKSADELMVNFSVRMTPELRDKLKLLGMVWLRKVIAKAKLPPKPD